MNKTLRTTPRRDGARGTSAVAVWLVVALASAAPAVAAGPAVAAEPAVVTASAGDPEPAVYGLAERAKAAYERHDFAEAARLYRAAFAADPSHPEALYGVGLAEQRRGHCEAALQALQRLQLALAPGHPLQARAAAVRAKCSPAAALAQPATATASTADPSGGGPSPAVQPSPTPTRIAGNPHLRPRPAGVAERWRLPIAVGLLGTGVAAGGWAAWSTTALDRQLGRLDGNAAASEQRTINAWSSLAVGTIVGGVAVLAWHLLASDDEDAEGVAERRANRAAMRER